jgi:putative DNA primase/helicase
MAADKKLNKLLYFASHGWAIFPVHWMNGNVCSCGDANCYSPGKHPLVPHGFYDATTDNELITNWHKRWAGANWAMRTGGKAAGGAGILIVDIDNKSGGFVTWDMLREDHPGAIETVSVVTGNGGQHLWFLYPDGYKIGSSQGILGPGIDIRANLGYALIPPSVTTQPYKFEINPDDVKIAELPEWILHSLNSNRQEKDKPKMPAAAKIGDVVQQGERHSTLLEIGGAMRRVGFDADIIQSTLQVLRDERFSDGDHQVTDDEITAVIDWLDSKNAEFAFTDLGNAERFLQEHSPDVRYCFTWEKWLIWDGKRWAIDDTAELQRKAHQTVRNIYIEAANAKDDNKRRAIASHAIHSESRSRIENMLHSAKPYVPILPSELDSQPMLLNVANGVIDLTTGELMPHKREYLLTKLIDIEYNPDAQCPQWNKFLDLVTAEDGDLTHFLQKAIGYSITGRTDEHCLFFLYGMGVNGKTTFTETIRRLLFDYAQRIDIEALMQNWNLGTAANPHIASMAGARFVLASEIAENRKINESLIKDLTGGDSLSARFLFSNPFTFIPMHKLWIFGNYKPKVSGMDWGFWRRIRVVPFNVTIPEGIRRPMSEVLDLFQAEMPGILAWAVLGCLIWQANGLDLPEAVDNATGEYRTEQDVLQQFIDEECIQHPDHQVEKDRLFTAWRNWCEDGGEEQAKRRSKKWLTRQLTTRGFQHGGDGNKCLIGLKLK